MKNTQYLFGAIIMVNKAKTENFIIKKTRRIIRKFGILKSLVLFTTISILLSISLTFLLLEIFELYIEPEVLFISLLVPLIVSPSVTLLLFQTVNNLDSDLKRLRYLLKRDDLTQIFNKKYFIKRATEVFNSAKKNSTYNFAILMADVDYFKKVNDTYGHLVGDDVLCKLAKICSLNVRENDLVARYGGEEFIILLSDVNLKKGLSIAERIREKVEQASFIHDNEAVKCTISIGISFIDDKILNIDELLRKADQALYDAKNNGRNCVVLK